MTTKIKIQNGIISEVDYDNYYDSLVGKNITVVSGCFCPPHRGHYELIKRTVENAKIILDEDVDVVLINFATSFNVDMYKSRHGIPYEQSLKMMKLYLQKMSSLFPNVIFYLSKDEDIYFTTRVPIDTETGEILINKRLNVVSLEGYDESQVDDLVKKTKERLYNVKNFAFAFPRGKEKISIQNHLDYTRKQLEEKMFIILLDRKEGGPSATKFTIFLRKGLEFEDISKETLQHFFPDTLSDDEMKEIIQDMKKYYNVNSFKECIEKFQDKPRKKYSCVKLFPNVESFIKTHFPNLKDIKVKSINDEDAERIIDKIIANGYKE